MIGPRSKEEVAAEARLILQRIEAGELKLSPDGESWDEAGDGNVYFVAENGWRFGIFNDAGGWDYIDSVTSSEGVMVDYDWLYENANDLALWEPENLENWPGIIDPFAALRAEIEATKRQAEFVIPTAGASFPTLLLKEGDQTVMRVSAMKQLPLGFFDQFVGPWMAGSTLEEIVATIATAEGFGTVRSAKPGI